MHPWRARLERWFVPVARRCPLSPNTITILALLLNAAAAWMFYERRFLIGMAFVIVGGFADAFDGVVARVQQKTSPYGDFLDHFCDRVSDSLLMIGWLLGNRVSVEIAMAVILAVTLNGYIGTQIEATFGQRRYDTMGRGEYLLALVICPIVSHILFANGWNAVAPAGLLIAEWIALLLLAFAILGIAQRLALASRLSR
jgi:phosphatidylglycerophosphate synthase